MAPTMATIAAWMLLLGICSVQADMYLNSWGLGTVKISRARLHSDISKMTLTIMIADTVVVLSLLYTVLKESTAAFITISFLWNCARPSMRSDG